jgi:hypothetical protein
MISPVGAATTWLVTAAEKPTPPSAVAVAALPSFVVAAPLSVTAASPILTKSALATINGYPLRPHPSDAMSAAL